MRCLPAALLLVAPVAFAQAQKMPTHVSALQPHDTALPVTRVSLYKNGVGFFEHTGSVSGNASVTINFTSGQLDDVLQSLTAIDLNGGRISGAGYNSTTPLDQQLKNLPLALSADPTSLDFYAAIRGTRVEVHSGAISITGRLLAIESRNVAPPNGDDSHPLIERQFITVVAENGETRTLELTPATSVQLLDTALHTDVNRYLQLLDSTRSQGLRHLTVQDNGTGPRELHLSYISEVPIWKSTYRILFTDASKSSSTQTATLQGWSVVDNTTGTDWINVHLSLIAGAPQSFIQPLSQPIYSRRPEVPIAQEAELTPQTFDSSNEAASASVEVSDGPPRPTSPKIAMPAQMDSRRRVSGMAGMAGGAPGGVFGGIVRGSGSGSGIGPGSGGNVGGGVYAPPSYEESAEASLTPSATAAGFDDFFSYNLTEPVTILKNQSALVPILQAKVAADRVTLVSSDGSTVQQPLRALWITNSSGLTLDRGSFTIVEDGNFGGEGLLDPIHAGEKRLLSYAADQAVQVSTEDDHNTEHIVQVTASKGILKLHHADVREITYIIHNAASDNRTIVLEQPIFRGYKLDSDVPATETTPTVYRFRQDLAAGQTTHLHVAEKHQGVTDYRLTNADDNDLTLILNQTGHNAKLEAALQPILEARRRVAAAQLAVDQTNTRLTALRADEDRQRANITALQHADKSSGDRFVKDLNKTEDSITAAQAELASRTTALDAARTNLSNLIESFQIDEAI